MGTIDEKLKASIERMKAFEPEEGYHLAFSGGKDSVVLKTVADMAGVKYKAVYRVTGIDPPEPKVVYQCSWCDEPIYEGEDCWDLSPYGWCCQNCMITRQCCAEEYGNGGF